MSDDGIFEQLRERFGGFFWLGVAGVVVMAMVATGAVLTRGLVDTAQKDLAQHAKGEVIAEENHMFNLQRTKLNEATIALQKGSFVACANAAQLALAGEKTAKIVLDAKWLMAQCSLLARDNESARDALQDFKDNANITDKRYELARAQLKAIERGESPGGLREW